GTDGLTGMLEESRIREVLETEADPAAASARLVADAVEAGGHDNVSVIVVDYPAPPPGVTLDSASPSDTVVADEHPPIAEPPAWSNQAASAEAPSAPGRSDPAAASARPAGGVSPPAPSSPQAPPSAPSAPSWSGAPSPPSWS